MTRLEEFDLAMSAIAKVPVGMKRTCPLPGCRESWTQGVTRGRQRVYCTAAHREAMHSRRMALVRREAKLRPEGDLLI
jgi:hypothetical protein